MNELDSLIKLNELLEKGTITQSEFDKLKAEILNQGTKNSGSAFTGISKSNSRVNNKLLYIIVLVSIVLILSLSYIYIFSNGKVVLPFIKLNSKNSIEKPNDGEYKEYYNNDNLKIVGKYKDGKEDGQWKEYYYEGSLQRIGNYINGKREGEWIEYYNSPNPKNFPTKIKSIGNYKNGDKVGLWKENLCAEHNSVTRDSVTYLGIDDYSYCVGIYKYGKRDGEWKTFKLKNNWSNKNTDTIAEFIENYNKGLLNGVLKEFNFDKNLFIDIGEFKLGKKEGKWIEHNWSNIDNIRIGNYLNGKRDGEWNEYCAKTKSSNRWRKEGDLISTMNYKNGKKEGEFKIYRDGGTEIWIVGQYANGRKCCEWKKYYSYNALEATCIYKLEGDVYKPEYEWESQTAKSWEGGLQYLKAYNADWP